MRMLREQIRFLDRGEVQDMSAFMAACPISGVCLASATGEASIGDTRGG